MLSFSIFLNIKKITEKISVAGSLTQAIRNFAKGLESWLTSAMAGCPQEMVDIKVLIVYLKIQVYN